MAERTPRAMRMAEVFNGIRSVLARMDPVRAEALRDEILGVLILMRIEARRWEGKEKLPLYQTGAIWDRVGNDDGAEITRQLHDFVYDLRPLENVEDLT
jgi:hypothetical protein